MSENVSYGKYSFEISKRDKTFFPKNGYTKGDLIDYYDKISDKILPYMKDRPLTMVRFPNGINDKKFFQKDAPDYFPDWIGLKSIKKQEDGKTKYVICNNKATLIYLANQACITPHLWLSKKDKLDYPDKMIFDLDPSDNDFNKVKSAAKKMKKFLEDDFGLPLYIMTTGSRGLHIIIPLKRIENFDRIRKFAQSIAQFLANKYPKEMTVEVRKDKRNKKLFIDTARNAFGQTSVTPYSVRPIEGAPIATPIDWKELNKSSLNAQSYNIKNIFKRLGKKEDPWVDMKRRTISISNYQKRISELTNG